MLLRLRARLSLLAQRWRAAFSDEEHYRSVTFSPEKPAWLQGPKPDFLLLYPGDLWSDASLSVRREIASGDYSIGNVSLEDLTSPERRPSLFLTQPRMLGPDDSGAYRRAGEAYDTDKARRALAWYGEWKRDGVTIGSPLIPGPDSVRKQHWWSRKR